MHSTRLDATAPSPARTSSAPNKNSRRSTAGARRPTRQRALARVADSRKPWRPSPMPIIRLSDDELSAVMAAARPLDPDLRDPFLRAVASALQGKAEIGPGVVARTCAELQRQFFDPPDLGRASVGKY